MTVTKCGRCGTVHDSVDDALACCGDEEDPDAGAAPVVADGGWRVEPSAWSYDAMAFGNSVFPTCCAVTGKGDPCPNSAHGSAVCGQHQRANDPETMDDAHPTARLHKGSVVVVACPDCEAVWDGGHPAENVDCPACPAGPGERCVKAHTTGPSDTIAPHPPRRRRAHVEVDWFGPCPESPAETGSGQQTLADGGRRRPSLGTIRRALVAYADEEDDAQVAAPLRTAADYAELAQGLMADRRAGVDPWEDVNDTPEPPSREHRDNDLRADGGTNWKRAKSIPLDRLDEVHAHDRVRWVHESTSGTMVWRSATVAATGSDEDGAWIDLDVDEARADSWRLHESGRITVPRDAGLGADLGGEAATCRETVSTADSAWPSRIEVRRQAPNPTDPEHVRTDGGMAGTTGTLDDLLVDAETASRDGRDERARELIREARQLLHHEDRS